MTALPNLFAPTAPGDSGRGRGRADVFAPEEPDGHQPSTSSHDLFSTEPLGDHRRPSPTLPLSTDATAPSWMPELLATVDARRSDPGRRDTFGEEGSIDLTAPRRADAVPRVVRRRRRSRRHGALRRLRPSWTLTTGDATLP